LWITIIERFANSVVFVDDWQYSVGCTKEFEAALRLTLPILDQRLHPLSYNEALQLLRAAVTEVGSVTGNGALLVRAAEMAERTASKLSVINATRELKP
jgi:hypothetical protein